ncbi:MAG TPA: TIR domain-containing protein, partial [Anaerolineales bacterium]
MAESKQGPQGSVFISYSRKDKEFVKKLNDALDNAGVQAWVDWEGIELASDWMQTITTAIQSHDAFIFVISPDSIKSKVCAEELELGINLNKKLIPILYREPAKGQKMHDKLSATNWVYMRKDDNFEDTVPKLIESIQTDLEWVSKHTQLLNQATEWEGKNKNNSFLLQGTGLEEAEKWMADASGKENRHVLPVQAEFIRASRKGAERRQRVVLVGISVALVVSIALSVLAVIARNDAKQQEAIAVESKNTAVVAQAIAEENRSKAEASQKEAEKNQRLAEEKTNIANAQKSAAQSQIYQGRAGEMDVSTLLAIDSYQRLETFQAENLIRINLGRMAVPVNQMSQDGAIWNIEWSPDFQYFVTGNNHDPSDQDAIKEACVWRAMDGGKVFCVEHEDDVNDAIFTKDGSLLITASADQTVKFWNAIDGVFVSEMKFDGAINDLDVSDSVLAIARDEGFLTLYYLYKPDVKPVNREETSGVYSVAFSPNGSYLAYGLTNGDVKFWQPNTNAFYNGPKHPTSNFVALTFSPDSNWLVSGGGDSLARLTKRDGTQQYSVPHGDWVEDVAFGPDPSWYVTASDDNKVRILETATGAELMRMSHSHFVQKVKVSPDGQWVASTGYDRVVRIWDSASGTQ